MKEFKDMYITTEQFINELKPKIQTMPTEKLLQRKKELQETPSVKYDFDNMFGTLTEYKEICKELNGRNDMNWLELLAEHSPVAKDIYDSGNYKIHCINKEECNFHPNGDCGCIELNDDYLGNIHNEEVWLRCDHLMWCDGWVENEDNNCVLLYGNHKGSFTMYLITHKS